MRTVLRVISFFVPGEPVGQGSMRHIGGGRMIAQNDKALRAWRRLIAEQAVYESQLDNFGSFTGAVSLFLKFWVSPKPMDRKQNLEYPVRPYDLDKLVRAVNDALSVDCDLVRNDSQVVDIVASKRFASEKYEPGVQISIMPVTESLSG